MADTISSFIHEIGNPLSNVYMIAQVLETETDISVIREYTSMLRQSVQQIKEIQADYNEYRKTGKMSTRPSVVNICTLLSSIVSEYRVMAQANNVEISLNFKPCRIFTDATKLKQAVSNLLSNAIKYNKPKGIVHVSCTRNADCIEIAVSDTGIGMEPTELKQLGTPFYRCKRIETNGTGLGFSLVKKIADSLGWVISVKSEVGQGTTVTISVR